MDAIRNSWTKAWASCGVENASATLLEILMAAYSEPHRRYHTLQHLAECLSIFDDVWSLAQRPGEVGLALWFHDAVYDVQAQDNEEKSAEWAHRALVEAGLPEDSAERVGNLVRVTRHTVSPSSPDEQLIVDIDLSILGAPPGRFDEYEEQVRAEYAWVPDSVFRSKRRAILHEFLSRPFIYGTAHFRSALEKAARDNLCRSIARLGIDP